MRLSLLPTFPNSIWYTPPAIFSAFFFFVLFLFFSSFLAFRAENDAHAGARDTKFTSLITDEHIGFTALATASVADCCPFNILT